MQNETAAYYLEDLITLLKENALEAKKLESKCSQEEKDYRAGYSFAYYEVVSLLQQQAEAFQIDLKDLKLDDIDADRDLL